MAANDRWHQLADGVQDSNLPASDKSVYRYLLDRADYKTAEMPAMFTPTRKTIRRKTSLSYSQVGYSTAHLQRHGWLTVKGKTGPGRPLEYELRLGLPCDCTGRVHVADVADDPQQARKRSNEKTGSDLHGWQRVAEVADLRGKSHPETAGDGQRCQPGTVTLPTDDPRTLPTNGANAAGQTVLPTERRREAGKEGRKRQQSDSLRHCLCGISLWATSETAHPAAWARHLAHIAAFQAGKPSAEGQRA